MRVLLAAGATHKISWLLTKDPVTSPLRAPFASYDGDVSGPVRSSGGGRGHGRTAQLVFSWASPPNGAAQSG